jgi:hypothetical protein
MPDILIVQVFSVSSSFYTFYPRKSVLHMMQRSKNILYAEKTGIVQLAESIQYVRHVHVIAKYKNKTVSMSDKQNVFFSTKEKVEILRLMLLF